MNWTPQQEAIFNFCRLGEGSLNIQALAGTGKTTTIVEIARRVPGRIFLGAFTKAISEELVSRVAGFPNAVASTLHSMGYRLWRETHPKTQSPDSRKIATMAREVHQYDKRARGLLADIVGFAKLAGFGIPDQEGVVPCPKIGDVEAWQALLDHHELTEEIPTEISVERMIKDAQWIYEKSLAMCNPSDGRSHIDFDDMLLAPLVFGAWRPQRFDWVLLDECQDTNETRRRLAQLILKPGGRFVAVGDVNQCQPTGTKVTLMGGGVAEIQNLSIGDQVVTLDQRAHVYVGTVNQARKVLQVHCRTYRGRLISVHAGGRVTKVTPNHKFFVRWSDRSTDSWVVYLMRKGNRFRVGWCQLFQQGGGFHLGYRARLEGADAAWVISTHKTKREASLFESITSTRYGIPLVLFNEVGCGAGLYTQDFLDEFWEKITGTVDLMGNAIDLLESAGRDLNYPLYTGKNGRQGRTTCFETQACNMISGMMSVPVFTETSDRRKPEWFTAMLGDETYVGNVYSLDVEGNHNYVADGILTKNSIFGFAGANSNAMDLIQQTFNSTTLPLSVTYRCPKRIVALAQRWVPGYEAAEENAEGVIERIDHPRFWKRFTTSHAVEGGEHQAILCRNTRPLVGIARRLRKEYGIPCMVEGNSARALVSLAVKWGEELELTKFLFMLSEHEVKEKAKFVKKGQEEKAEALHERCSILRDLAKDDMKGTVRHLVSRIELLFGLRNEEPDSSTLRLCTIHRAKGREWDRVWLIGRNTYQPSFYAKTPEQLQQERNLEYVAVTRVRRELVEVDVPPRVQKGKGGGGERPECEWWEE